VVDQIEPLKLNINTHKNKYVHSKDGHLLGTLDSINKDNLVVKKDVIDSIYYHIPTDKIERYDDHGIWVKINQIQALKNHLNIKNKNKTNVETATFRLNPSIMNDIRFEADNRMISLNDMMNQILKRFVEWNQFEPISGMVHIPKTVVRELFKKKSNEEIIEMAEFVGKSAIFNTVLLMRDTIDLQTFLIWVEEEMSNHSLYVRHNNENGVHKYIIKHDLGLKFSLYYKTIINSIFSEHFKAKINFTTTDDLLLFEFESLNLN
jgi:hypothetical protein